MKKKALSLSLALSLCLSLAVPALAAETKVLSDFKGGSIALDGVLSSEEITFPFMRYGEAGEVVEMVTATVYRVAPGSNVICYNNADKDLVYNAGSYDPTGISEYGCINGMLNWGDGSPIDNETLSFPVNEGEFLSLSLSTYEYESSQNIYVYAGDRKTDLKAIVEAGVAEYAAYDALPKAYERSTTVRLHGLEAPYFMLTSRVLKDANGYETNYVELRDLGDKLTQSGAAERFNVTWENNAIHVQTRTDYAAPQESSSNGYLKEEAPYSTEVPSIFVDGKEVQLEGILLTDDQGGGHTYYKLRDLGAALGFGVDWSVEEGVFLTCTGK